MSRGRILLLFSLALAPFLARPLFFDEGVMIASARAAAEHPGSPHSFRFDAHRPGIEAWPRAEGPVHTHPPLTAWLMALGAPGTTGTWKLRLVMAILAVLGAAAGGTLAARLGAGSPALFYLAFCPAYFLTSMTFYPHLTYLAAYGATLFATVQWGKTGHPGWAMAAGAALATASLSLHQWPVLAAAVVLLGGRAGAYRHWRGSLAALGVFTLIAGGWWLHEIHLYGVTHLSATFQVRSGSAGYPWAASFLPAVFLAAGCPFIAVGWIYLWRRDRRWVLTPASIGVVLGVLLAGRWGGFSAMEAAVLSLAAATTLAFLGATIHRAWRGEPADRTLAAWLFLEFVFLQKFLALPAGHHLLPLALVSSIVAARMLDAAGMGFSRTGAAVLAGFTLMLAHADASHARLAAHLPEDLPAPVSDRWFYWGNDFGPFEASLKKRGWRAYDKDELPRPGDMMLFPRAWNAQGSYKDLLRNHPYEILERKLLRQANPFRTLSLTAGAGWYSASWGALPYTLSFGPVEEMTLVRFRGTSSPEKGPA
jgi:hypothetical protein